MATDTTLVVSAKPGESGRNGQRGLAEFFKNARLLVLANVIPMKIAAVHSHINAPWQALHESQCTAEVEQPVRATELDGDHSTSEYNGFVFYALCEHPPGFSHGIGAMGDDNLIFFTMQALLHDQFPVVCCHVQAIDHHERTNLHRHAIAPLVEQLLHMCILEIELSVYFIVFFVESTTRNEDAYGHGVKISKKRFCARKDAK